MRIHTIITTAALLLLPALGAECAAADATLRPSLHFKADTSLRRPILAVRTNLLMPLLNAGVEVAAGNRWSVAADFYFPWCPREWMNRWDTPQMTCLQALGGFIEGRYHPGAEHAAHIPEYGKYLLLGHSVSLLGGGAYYDVESKGRGQQGEILVGGIGYTYAIPVGRKGAVHLEFDLAIGIVYRIWHPYNVNCEGGYLIYQKDGNNRSIVSTSSWSFLPIRAGICLAVPVFARNRALTNKPGRK